MDRKFDVILFDFTLSSFPSARIRWSFVGWLVSYVREVRLNGATYETLPQKFNGTVSGHLALLLIWDLDPLLEHWFISPY